MSLYKPKKSPYYHFDFQLRGRRFYGSTEATTRKAAALVEDAELKKAKQFFAEQDRIGSGPMTVDTAVDRYWEEVGKHHAGFGNTWTNLQRLAGYFGKEKLLAELDDAEVAKLVAWRRGQRVKDNPKFGFVSPATVNRSTTEMLKKLLNRARDVWKVDLPNPPAWKRHMLKEPEERVRELRGEEGGRIDDEMRADLEPFFAFARASGLRLAECFIGWDNVDWDSRTIETTGKGGLTVRTVITSEIREILWPLRGNHFEAVFTYQVQRTVRSKKLVKGQRRPLTYNGLKSYWRRMKKRAGLADFRFHDFRHDLGTKLLRETGNLKLVQKALNHRNIKTTVRYAHVLDEDLRAGMERVAKSRKKSRTPVRKRSSA